MSINLSGSLVLTGSLAVTGEITMSGSIASASYAASSSYALNAELLDNRDSSTFANTGSNIFSDGQYISSSFNPTGFSTTASLYTDGGLRVTKDAYISGTLYLNNVTVYGTQSVCYITSSQLNIASNLISVNTATPSVRYGGLAVYDSGSTSLTGSILWDSEANHWIYSNPSGSSYSGGMFISGPRSAALGSETGTTSCMLLAGQGGDHLTSSMIYHSSNATCFYGNALFVSSSCNVGIGTSSPNYTTAGRTVLAVDGSTSALYALQNIGTSAGYLYGDSSNITLWAEGSRNLTIGVASAGTVSLGTNNSSRLTIASTGIATFACRICAPSLSITGDSLFCSAGSTTITLEGTTPIINLTRNNNASSPAAQLNFKTSQGTVRWQIASNAAIGTGLEINQGDSTSNRIYIDTNGITCFACQVCIGGNLTVNGGTIEINCNNTTSTDARINLYTRSATNGDRATIYGYNLAATTTGCEITYLAFGYCCTNNQGYINMQTKSGGAWCNTMNIINGSVGIGTTSPSYKLDISTAQSIRVVGSSTGYTQGSIIFQSSTTDTPEARGLGVYAFNEGTDATWFYGTAYNAADSFVINRKAGTTYQDSAASVGEASTFLSINNTGRVGLGTTNVSTEANLFLGAQGSTEGGQLVLQKGTSCSCATHLDNYQDSFRVLVGSDTTSTGVNLVIDHKTRNACFYGTLTAPIINSTASDLSINGKAFLTTLATSNALYIITAQPEAGSGTSAAALITSRTNQNPSIQSIVSSSSLSFFTDGYNLCLCSNLGYSLSARWGIIRLA